MTGTKKFRDGLLAVVLILFVVQALLLPFVVGTTYASKGRTPEHIITYSGHRLRWDAYTVLDENGAAQLDFLIRSTRMSARTMTINLLHPALKTAV